MIPLSVPNISGNEWKYVKECLDTNWISSVGSYVTLFENKVAEFCGARSAIATSNGTAALHISLILSGVKQNDLVIIPNITFVAPANAIKYVDADPILIDIDINTWQIDLNLLNRFLSEETNIKNNECIHKKSQRVIRAILPVHVLGNICQMDCLLKLANEYRLAVVEDSTEALGSFYNNQHGGTFGALGCLSFNGNKIISTGGGGMILTNDEQLGKKAKHLTTQAKASPEEYYHDEVGYNYRLVNLLAAVGVAQMEQFPFFLQRKKEIRKTYDEALRNMDDIKFQGTSDKTSPNSWLYTIRVGDQSSLRQYLVRKNIEARPFWVPMNQLPAFKNCLYYHTNDISNEIYNHCLSLPCSTGLSEEDQATVIRAIFEFYNE